MRYVTTVVEQIDDEYGLDCTQLFIVNVSLPEAVEKALDTRTSMGVIGDMDRYQQYQMGTAMTAAAENPSGGGAADGLGLGMGVAMASRMMPGMTGGAAAAGGPPPPPQASPWHVADNGKSNGPFSKAQIIAGINNGEVLATTMVWNHTLGDWTAAGEVQELASHFAAKQAPPPPPPANS